MGDITADSLIGHIYHLKVHIPGISPKVYRRFKVEGSTNILQLHHILQVIMGWEDLHLNRFHIWGVDYGVYHYGGKWFRDDPWRITLDSLELNKGDSFLYEYGIINSIIIIN